MDFTIHLVCLLPKHKFNFSWWWNHRKEIPDELRDRSQARQVYVEASQHFHLARPIEEKSNHKYFISSSLFVLGSKKLSRE